VEENKKKKDFELVAMPRHKEKGEDRSERWREEGKQKKPKKLSKRT